MEFTEREKDLIFHIIKEIKMDELCTILERAYPKADEAFLRGKVNELAEIIYKSDPKKFSEIEAKRKALYKEAVPE